MFSCECGEAYITEQALETHKKSHSLTLAERIPIDRRSKLLSLIRTGGGPLSSARAAGIAPEDVKTLLKTSPEFAQAVASAEEEAAEEIEQVLYELATDTRDFRAVNKWLENRSPDRWKERTDIRVDIVTKIEQLPLDDRIKELERIWKEREEADIIEATIVEEID